ncbi:MAG: hypothetical protein JW838_14810 [Spirochaetes bacterium]|nr:hypothetical protein [Spirochaetota bacterium]
MKTEALPLLHRRGGYEIQSDGSTFLFINRKTYGAGLGALISGGVATIIVTNAALQYLFMDREIALIIAVPGAVFLAVFAFFLYTYLRRRIGDPSEVSERHVLDLGARTLCHGSGSFMARLEEIAFACAYNPLSRTYGLFIVLPSKKKIRVYAEWVPGLTSRHVNDVRDEIEHAVAFAR